MIKPSTHIFTSKYRRLLAALLEEWNVLYFNRRWSKQNAKKALHETLFRRGYMSKRQIKYLWQSFLAHIHMMECDKNYHMDWEEQYDCLLHLVDDLAARQIPSAMLMALTNAGRVFKTS
jgi:hypothetical protein